ncbi:ROK family protein [Puniceicoccus vermicola]|uniref:ROK family protein n=1 Tax=Puniceicoccus vermicola TaxID=388746 RepID=A0A7X1AZK9_9BACT|nr:ROK family protein [Puniceicoccus vermicola]MBC2602891.1 ROK family protein [Puniceicoccus vermicola]
MLIVEPKFKPELDTKFLPASLWNREFRRLVDECVGKRMVTLQVTRPDQTSYERTEMILPDEEKFRELNWRFCERLVKSLLWIWGGSRIRIAGAPEIMERLKACYSPGGERAFDAEFMGMSVFREPFEVSSNLLVSGNDQESPSSVSRVRGGCRIGFDLGGSDRKCAALIDGEVVFSEEVAWDPYFQTDPNYHLEGIADSLERAARHLPRVDAIGGSAAGVYIDNEPRLGSLFRGVAKKDFEAKVRPVFHELQKKWGGIPFVVANDGDVTALAGAISLGRNRVLGLSFGTSEAAGYVDRSGRITGWLNELAFVPVDYRKIAPTDEWSGDRGCGVQYLSQQGVGRLLPETGIPVKEGTSLPDRLVRVQECMEKGDDRAAAVYRTLGVYLGYSVAHYADFYDIEKLIMVGRVTSGEGGQVMQAHAEKVLETEFPQLARKISISMPDEKMKRHGQAVAAASLPVVEGVLL